MSYEEMLSIKEVLKLINHKFNYAIDPFSRELLKIMVVDDNVKYAIPSRAFRKYIDEYINRKYEEKYNKIPVTDEEKNKILFREGATKGLKYKKEDIIRMLNDEKVFGDIKRRVIFKSICISGDEGAKIYVPKAILAEYRNEGSNPTKEIQKYRKKLRQMSSDELNTELESLREKQRMIEKELEEREFEDRVLFLRNEIIDKLDIERGI